MVGRGSRGSKYYPTWQGIARGDKLYRLIGEWVAGLPANERAVISRAAKRLTEMRKVGIGTAYEILARIMLLEG